MAKQRSRTAVQAEIEALQAELDTAETDDEIWVKGDDGREYKVTGRRATSIFAKLGLTDDSEGEEGEGDEGDQEPEDDPAPKGGYFGRGKK